MVILNKQPHFVYGKPHEKSLNIVVSIIGRLEMGTVWQGCTISKPAESVLRLLLCGGSLVDMADRDVL